MTGFTAVSTASENKIFHPLLNHLTCYLNLNRRRVGEARHAEMHVEKLSNHVFLRFYIKSKTKLLRWYLFCIIQQCLLPTRASIVMLIFDFVFTVKFSSNVVDTLINMVEIMDIGFICEIKSLNIY